MTAQAQLAGVLLQHHPIRDQADGPIVACECGGAQLGDSWSEHVAQLLAPIVEDAAAIARADELAGWARAMRIAALADPTRRGRRRFELIAEALDLGAREVRPEHPTLVVVRGITMAATTCGCPDDDHPQLDCPLAEHRQAAEVIERWPGGAG